MELPQKEMIQTSIVLVVLFIIRIIINYLVLRFSKRKNKVAKRAKLIMKYVDFTLLIIATLFALGIWSINPKDISWLASSVFAVIGIGFFAQWSIISNITSGVIIFFTLPYKIGDRIKIHDKDFPIIAVIEDIKAFHINLRTDEGGLHTYPNNLLLQKGVTLVEKGVQTQIVEQNAGLPVEPYKAP
jgi:small-conductance mechanosensitive channel